MTRSTAWGILAAVLGLLPNAYGQNSSPSPQQQGEMMLNVIAAPDWPGVQTIKPQSGSVTWKCAIDTTIADGNDTSISYKVLEKVVLRRNGKTGSLVYQADGEIIKSTTQNDNGKECQHITKIPIQFQHTKSQVNELPDLIVNKKLGLARFSIGRPSPFPSLAAPFVESGTCNMKMHDAGATHNFWALDTLPMPNYGATKSKVSEVLNRWKPKDISEIGGYMEVLFANGTTRCSATLDTKGLCWHREVPLKITVEWDMGVPPKKPTPAR